MASWRGRRLLHFRVQAAYRTGTKLRSVLQREDEQKWEWIIPKEEAGYRTSAQSAGSSDTRQDKEKWERVSPKTEAASNTGSNDSRPAPPRGFVAAMTTRSVAVQTEDPICALPVGTLPQPPKRWMSGARCTNGVLSRAVLAGTAEGVAQHPVCPQQAAGLWAFVGLSLSTLR